jgi:hypothetical protein
MPTAVFSFKRLEDGSVLIHTVVSPAKATADKHLKQHADICPQFGPAFHANATIEFAREVDYIPHFSGDDLEDWLDTLLDGADEADDEIIEVDPE